MSGNVARASKRGNICVANNVSSFARALFRRNKGTKFLLFIGSGYVQIRVVCTKVNFKFVTKDEGKT